MTDLTARYDWAASVALLEGCQLESLSDDWLVALHEEATYHLEFLELQGDATAAGLLSQTERLYREIVSRPRLKRMGVVKQYRSKVAATLAGKDPERRPGRKRDPDKNNPTVAALRVDAPRRLIARALDQEGRADLRALSAAERRAGRPRLGEPAPPAADELERKRRHVYRTKETREFMERVTTVQLPWPIRRAST